MKIFNVFSLFLTILICQLNGCQADNDTWDETSRFVGKDEYRFVTSIRLTIERYPYTMHICTGVLITRRHVLTLTHCIAEVDDLTAVSVRLGSNDLDSIEKRYSVKRWTTYDLWAEYNNVVTDKFEHDILILKLHEMVDCKIVPAVIASGTNENFFEKKAETVIWSTKGDVRIPRYLKAAALDVISYDECMQELRRTPLLSLNHTVQRTYLCTKLNLGAILVNDDSGAPLLINGNEVIAINDPTYLQRRGIYAAPNLNFHVGIDYYRAFIENAIQIKKGAWWKRVAPKVTLNFQPYYPTYDG